MVFLDHLRKKVCDVYDGDGVRAHHLHIPETKQKKSNMASSTVGATIIKYLKFAHLCFSGTVKPLNFFVFLLVVAFFLGFSLDEIW